jgi:hypothetical protein
MLELIGLAFRGSERLIIVAAAFVSIWLGYKLFALVISNEGSFEGELGQWKVKMQRIAPGVFFALFGASVLMFALYSPYTLGNANSQAIGNKDAPVGGINYSNDFNPTSDADDAIVLLGSLANTRQILDKYSQSFSAADRSSFLQSQAPIDRLRRVMVDVAFEKGRLDWYVEKNKEFIAAGSKTTSFSNEDAVKFNAVKQFLNPEKI